MKRNYKIPKLKDFNFSKSREDGDFLAPYTNRPISKYFSWVFVHFTLCAEFIALLTPLMDAITIYAIYQGQWILAAILVELSLIMDSSDGEVARFRATLKKRTEKQNQFGGYMDSMAGVLIFPLTIFAAGYFMGSLMTGLFVMLSFCLINMSSGYSGTYFKDKKEQSKRFQEGFLNKIKKKLGIKGVVGFSGDIQKHLIALALLFQSLIFLWAYFAIAITVIGVKFYIYRK